ncbi:uncharacterized protein LOC131806751 [Musca domestica]|uniref:Uncharacterized protein LOC131806751 n=1 Tax=Musca domestica TaxID=7370 RepID=A0ABM3VNM7_MUSDO|nr:uncharacterized protein LOC131806751 [Musca domestica]
MCDNFVSKRHLRRLVKKEIENFSNCTRQTLTDQELSAPIEINQSSNEGSQSENFNIHDEMNPNDTSFSSEKKDCIDRKLASWVINNRVSNECCNSLLSILKSEGINVALCKETLLKALYAENSYCPNESPSISQMPPGEYFHFGLEKALMMHGQYLLLNAKSELLLDVFVDGMPLYKSSSTSLWPILCSFSEFKNSQPFLIATYIGKSKPPDVKDFLKRFVEEYIYLKNEGFKIGDKYFTPKIRLFVCDTPARAFLTGTVGHTSAQGCSKCEQEASYKNKRLNYAIVPGNARTDEAFLARKSQAYHIQQFRSETHPLELCNIKMVTQFPLDTMHLIDLGVFKKMLRLILQNKHTKSKLNVAEINELNRKILYIAKYTPKEFARKGRLFDEVCRWKAKEFRQVVLYTGIIIFKNILHEDLYTHFLLLHTAYRMVSCPSNCHKNLQCVQQLMEAFVADFALIYGSDKISYNVHNLLHLAKCVENFGNVENFSSYKYENFLQTLKKDCRKPSYISQQLNNRCMERHLLLKTNDPKFLPLGQKHRNNLFMRYKFDTYFLSGKSPDNFCFTMSMVPIKVYGFLVDSGEEYVVGNAFTDAVSLFQYPVDSKKCLGICKAKTLNIHREKINMRDIYCKIFCVPDGEYFVFIPILHHCQI